MKDFIPVIVLTIVSLWPIFNIILIFVIRLRSKRNGKTELRRKKVYEELEGDDTPYGIWKRKMASNPESFSRLTLYRDLICVFLWLLLEIIPLSAVIELIK